MEKTETLILDPETAEQKIERMAIQIWENNSQEKEIVLAGIANRGYKLANILAKKLSSVSPLEVKLVEICIDKKDPFKAAPSIDCEAKSLKNKSIIVVDDVLNSGRTLLFAMLPFMEYAVKRLSVAVLMNRSYRNFPVEAKYVGTSLSTTLQENIQVEFGKNGKISAYLR